MVQKSAMIKYFFILKRWYFGKYRQYLLYMIYSDKKDFEYQCIPDTFVMFIVPISDKLTITTGV